MPNEPNTGSAERQANPQSNNSHAEWVDDLIGAELAHAAEAEEGEHERFDPEMRRAPRMALADFKRDTDMRNVLINGRWGVRGCISMHVSTTGSGKSILQTQSALCFNRGIKCCGLQPVRPFRSWIIQSEDDEDRVALDRDDVVAELARMHPGVDWDAAMAETKFLDFDGVTGAGFVERLNNELFEDPPDAVIINPFNAYFGGNIKDGADVSAFFKGGVIRNRETEGLEKVLKRHKVWGWIFAHTGKPPTAKELHDWLNDPYSAYKMCGASEIADAVRSIITFLKCPGTDGVFTFTAGKNGTGLKWTNEAGDPSTRGLWQWGEDGRHYWRDVPKSEWAAILTAAARKQPKRVPEKCVPVTEDETHIVVEVFERCENVVSKETAINAIKDAINEKRQSRFPPEQKMSREEARNLFDDCAARGVIKVLPKGKSGARGAVCGLPEVVDRYQPPPALDVPADVLVDVSVEGVAEWKPEGAAEVRGTLHEYTTGKCEK